VTVGVYDTLQLAVPTVAPVRVHVVVGAKVPVELVVKLTVPVGVVGLVEVSATVAVQVVDELTCIEEGEQTIAVVVVWMVGGETVIGSHELLATVLLESPLYVASNPKVPVVLNVTDLDVGIVPPVIVTIETVLEVPEQDPLVTVGKSK
jgi:hypothetical protein